jgi:hypothetical protein
MRIARLFGCPAEQPYQLSLVRVGTEYSAGLCDLGVFVDEAAEPVSSDDLDVGVDEVG